MSLRNFCAALLILFPTGLALASLVQAQERLSWKSCVLESQKNNAELQSALQNYEASRDTARSTFSPFLPQLTASAQVRTTESSGNTATVTGTSISATQNLFNGWQDRARIDQALAQSRVFEAKVQAAQAKASFDLQVAYTGLLTAERLRALQAKIIRRRQDNLKLVELRFEGGRENKGSVLLSQAYLAQARYEELQARNQLRVSRSQLLRTLGRDENSELDVTEDVPLHALEPEPPFRSLAMATPDYLAAIAQEESSQSAQTIARSGFFPTLALSASSGRISQLGLQQNESLTFTTTVSFPFFSGGRDFFSTRSASSTASAATKTRENTLRQAYSSLQQAHASYQEAIEKLRVDLSFREAALKRAEIGRGKYNNGLMSFEDWDLIENDLILRERSVLQSEQARAIADATWQQAQGKGVFQ